MNPYSFFVVFEGSGQIHVPYAEGGNSNAVIRVVAASGSPVEAVLFQQHRGLWSCSRTEGQAQHAGVGTGTLSHLGCRPVCKSWVISFLLSGILVLVPAGERVNREPSSHTHIIVGLCSCLSFALGTFLHGHLAGELPVWCRRQVQSLHGQSSKTIASSTESRSLEKLSVYI